MNYEFLVFFLKFSFFTFYGMISTYPFINNALESIKNYFISFSKYRDRTNTTFSYNLIQNRVKRCEKQIDLVIIKDDSLFNLWNDIKKIPFGNIESTLDKLSILISLKFDDDAEVVKIIQVYGYILLFSNFANFILAISQSCMYIIFIIEIQNNVNIKS